MGSKKQRTLFESWGGRGGHDNNECATRAGTSVTEGVQTRNGRGRGATTKLSRGQGQRGGGRGRGRGRGSRGVGREKRGGRAVAENGPINNAGFEGDEDDDDICELALSHFELATNDTSKAFEDINSASDLPGFDKAAGDIWIYPTNKPVRDYQFNIVQTALYNNTLVSLPTGLGKTFIAAVVMFNFHRWYPNSLIIFMAPTRPLVTQQLDACHALMGIAPEKMVELTGHTLPKKREVIWKEKTVFFLTPQVLQSDLSRGSCPAGQVRCIVVDEAHKALGNHAFAQVISEISKQSKHFRVLALSATPGSDIAAVQEVFKNLLISKVELRSENSQDILPYTHQKQVEKIVVPLDENLTNIYDQLMGVFQHYTGKLMTKNVLFGRDGSSFTQFQLLRAREMFRSNPPPSIPNYQRGYLEVDFATCISLVHAMDLLVAHGLRSFYSFLQGVFNREKGTPAVAAELRKNSNLEEILRGVQLKLNISVENSRFDVTNNGLFTSFSKDNDTLVDLNEDADYLSSHPKMRVLKDLILKHFTENESNSHPTRVMIFSQYRDSVQEIGNMLNSLRPLVKPMVFIGQSSTAGTGRGLKQKDQVQVVQSFRDGQFNVLVSTCVGEEGLDIGEVDLIVCFDVNKSPTRLVQRMGRTGRQRNGKTIFLLTKGKEEKTYLQSLQQHSSINKTIIDANVLNPYLYKESPRMVPAGVKPQCYKMEIILSSEQKQKEESITRLAQRTTIKEVEIPDPPVPEDVDFDVPIRKSKKTSNVKQANKGTSNKNLAEATENSNKRNDRARQCRLTLNNGKELCLSKNPENKNLKILNDSDCMVLEQEHRAQIDSETDSNYKLLCDVFDLKDINADSTAGCIFIPKAPKPFNWLPNYDGLTADDLALTDFDIQCISEQINATYMMGPVCSHCDCGLPYGEYFDCNAAVANNERVGNSEIRNSVDILKCEPETTVQQHQNASNLNEKDLIFEENDPFFDDETPDMFEPILEENWPILEKHNKVVDVDDGGTKTCIENLVEDYDSNASTASDEAFLSLVRSAEQSQRSGRVRLVKEDDYVRFVCEPGTPPKNNKAMITDNMPPVNAETPIPICSTPKRLGGANSFHNTITTPSNSSANSSRDIFSPSPIRHLRTSEGFSPTRKFQFKQNPSIKRNPASCAVPAFCSDLENFNGPKHLETELVNSEETLGDMIKAATIKPRPPSPSWRENGLIETRLESPKTNSDRNSFWGRTGELREDCMSPDMFEGYETPDMFMKSPSPKKFKFVKGSATRRSLDNNEVFYCHESPKQLSNVMNSDKGCQFKPGVSKASDHLDLMNSSAETVNWSQFDCFVSNQQDIDIPDTSNTTSVSKINEPSSKKEDYTKLFFDEKLPNQRQTSLDNMENNLPVIKPMTASHSRKATKANGWYNMDATDSDFLKPRNKSSTTKSKTGDKSTAKPWTMRPTVPAKVQEFCNSVKFNPILNEDHVSGLKASREQVPSNILPQRKTKKRSRVVNEFVQDEAEVSGDDDSTADEQDDLSDSDLDAFDSSFVSQSHSERVTESQQVRYMRSVKDLPPVRNGRIEKPLEPANNSVNSSWDNEYEADSFCVPENEVEYADVGVYTQAMLCAEEELQLQILEQGNKTCSDSDSVVIMESPASKMPRTTSDRSLRSRRRQGREEVVHPKSKRRRRRIITYSDEDDD